MTGGPGSRDALRRRLLPLVERELESPREPETFWNDLAEALPEHRPLVRLLEEKDRQHRHAFYVRSEHVWYRRFSWRIMRPLFVVAVVAAIGYSFQRLMDPTLGLASFLLGAALLYLAIQWFAQRWMTQNERRLAEVEGAYRERLEALRRELEGGR